MEPDTSVDDIEMSESPDLNDLTVGVQLAPDGINDELLLTGPAATYIENPPDDLNVGSIFWGYTIPDNFSGGLKLTFESAEEPLDPKAIVRWLLECPYITSAMEA
jgi:hypothetical protein